MYTAAEPMPHDQERLKMGTILMRSSATILELVNKNKDLEAENKRYRSAQEAIRESEERFRLISETIHFGVFEIDDEGSCLYTNTSYQKIFGLSLVESLTHDWREFLHADDREGVSRKWELAMQRMDTLSMDCRIVRPDGELRWVHVHSEPVFSDPGGRHLRPRRLHLPALQPGDAPGPEVTRRQHRRAGLQRRPGRLL